MAKTSRDWKAINAKRKNSPKYKKARKRADKKKLERAKAERRSRPAINLAGLSYEDIIRLVHESGNKLTAQDYEAIERRLRSMANSRLTRLERKGLASRSMAYKERQKTRRKKTTSKGKKGDVRLHHRKARRFQHKKVRDKSKQRQQTMKEVTELMNFLSRKSTTPKGVSEILLNIERQIGHFESDDEIKDFFDMYHRMLEENQISRERTDGIYMALRGILYDLTHGDEPLSYEDAMKRMSAIIDELESKNDEELEDMGMDDFRELGKSINEDISKDEDFTIQTQETYVSPFDPSTWGGVPKKR